MQQARYYLLGERAVVLELSPPVTLPSQQRIWALAEKLNHHPDVREVVPGMNNLTLLLHTPQADAEAMLALLQQGWESKESLTPESRRWIFRWSTAGSKAPIWMKWRAIPA